MSNSEYHNDNQPETRTRSNARKLVLSLLMAAGIAIAACAPQPSAPKTIPVPNSGSGSEMIDSITAPTVAVQPLRGVPLTILDFTTIDTETKEAITDVQKEPLLGYWTFPKPQRDEVLVLEVRAEGSPHSFSFYNPENLGGLLRNPEDTIYLQQDGFELKPLSTPTDCTIRAGKKKAKDITSSPTHLTCAVVGDQVIVGTPEELAFEGINYFPFDASKLK